MMHAEAMQEWTQEIVHAVGAVVGHRRAGLHEPTFAGNEWQYVKECLDSTFVSSVGKFVDRFEADLAAYTGAKYAVAVVNGTAALHMALKLAGVVAQDEVLVPALTFVATANAVSYCGAIPHFVDSEEKTLGVDVEKLRAYLVDIVELRGDLCVNRRTGRIVRAIVPMHTFGHPVDLDGTLRLAGEFHLEVVEDAAESLGSWYRGQHTGTFGRLGTLSFNGNKTITTGGGGAILTNDRVLAQQAKHLTTTAKVAHAWEYSHDAIGYNYRLPNLNAALGCAQLEKLTDMLRAKRKLHQRYVAAFANVRGVRVFSEPPECRSNYWLQALLLDREGQIGGILHGLNAAGFMSRPIWRLMHELPPFRNCPRMDLSGAVSLGTRVLNIPSSPGLVAA